MSSFRPLSALYLFISTCSFCAVYDYNSEWKAVESYVHSHHMAAAACSSYYWKDCSHKASEAQMYSDKQNWRESDISCWLSWWCIILLNWGVVSGTWQLHFSCKWMLCQGRDRCCYLCLVWGYLYLTELFPTGDTEWRGGQLTTVADVVWDWTSRQAAKTQHSSSSWVAWRRS